MCKLAGRERAESDMGCGDYTLTRNLLDIETTIDPAGIAVWLVIVCWAEVRVGTSEE